MNNLQQVRPALALIIEDDPVLSKIFSITLRNHFEIETITDGGWAIPRLNQIVPDLIVLDLHLPNVSGLKILQYIRTAPSLKNTRVIVTTADALQADLLQDEADIVLLKPVNPMQLRDLAGRLIPVTGGKQQK
jgi:CheY-like chemotaxis protein